MVGVSMKVKEVKKPWGNFQRYVNNKVTVKILLINKNKRFSLQSHKNRTEFWEFLDNRARVTIGNTKHIAVKGSRFFIKKRQLHRIEAFDKPVRVLEISSGKFDEKDIVRFEDDFNRVKK